MEEVEHCECAVPDMRVIGGDVFCVGCGSPILPLGQQSSAFPENSISIAAHFLHKQLVKRTDFRLIRLLPGQRHDPIVCEILRLSLEDNTAYEAVSYTWGDQSATEPIFTQAGPLQVTFNCKAALLDLRDRYEDRQLWIDAICINQTDNAEKNHQVPLMSTIYSKAHRVVIHLGSEHTSDSHIQRFFHHVQEWKRFTSDEDQKTVTAFLSRPWFSRVWVQQEAAVARKAVIIMGPQVLDWAYLTPGRLDVLGVQAVNNEEITPPVLVQRDKKPFKDIVSLLNTARRCRSTDPRDNIFALLGLLQSPDDLKLTPNYDMPVADLYMEVTSQTIKNYNHIDILTDIWQQNQPRITRQHSMGLQRAVAKAIESLTIEGLGESLVEHLITEMQHASKSILAHHWRKFNKIIDKITSTASGHNLFMKPQIQAFYDAFGVSLAAEAREIPSHVRVSSPETPIIAKSYETPSYALLSSFSICQNLLPWDPHRDTAQLTAAVFSLPSEPRTLIRDALYMVFFILSMDGASQDGEILLPEPTRENARYGHAISLPSWTPNFSDNRQHYSLAYWRPKQKREASQPPVATVYSEPTVEKTGLENPMSHKVNMLKLDSIKYLFPIGDGPFPPKTVQLLETPSTEVVLNLVMDRMNELNWHEEQKGDPPGYGCISTAD